MERNLVEGPCKVIPEDALWSGLKLTLRKGIQGTSGTKIKFIHIMANHKTEFEFSFHFVFVISRDVNN